ncbi:MAG: ATPase, T2SS/T4P/T4SS family [Abditibacteriales bacterium]|nr:ATPase, T2SS/T4P/T4SS family [Abditibacteriales bacterium]MDW8366137.1 ATPase, T2SS/T4P/T4SS family [Abditibacteriales bacterium]
MNRIDRIVDFMVKRQGRQFTMQSDDNCILYTADGRQPLNRLMTVAEIEEIVEEILPDGLQSQLARSGSFTFPYHSMHGLMTLRVSRRNGVLRVSVHQGEVAAEEISETEPEPFVPPPSVSIPTPQSIEAGYEPDPAPPSEPSQSAEPADVPPAAAPQPTAAAAPPTVEEVEVAAPAAPDYLLALFELAAQRRASDLHLQADTPPFLRVREDLEAVADVAPLNAAQLHSVLWQIAPRRCEREWAERGETYFGYDFQGRVRFRCHVFKGHRGIAAACRLIPSQARTVEELGLPATLNHLARLPSGLIIVSGQARSGRSTTLTALIEHINQNRSAHIVTVEQPIEFIFRSRRCLITQREVPTHVASLPEAWRQLMHTDADVCFIGELTDSRSLLAALDLAERGRLVFATMSQPNATGVVISLLHRFTPTARDPVSLRLIRCLRAVVAQTLCRDTQDGLIAAAEILVMTPPVAARIREGNFGDLEGLMWSGAEGMITLNESLFLHVQSGRITLDEARRKSLDPDGLERLSR